jgi:GTP-binding protein
MFTVAIIGRPNVGKSTLFNRLVGKKLALVDDRPGVTRDRREGDARLGDLFFKIVDTAGLEEGSSETLPGRTRAQTEAALEGADAIFFVFDARTGLVPEDRYFANLVRRAGKPLIVIANKAEGRYGADGATEGYDLGLGDPVPLSAEHGDGFAELYAALRVALPAATEAPAEPQGNGARVQPDDEDGSELDPTKPLRVAIIGRPNAGKSTLLNAILGENRLLTGPEPGLTRDTIGVELTWQERKMKMFDTAGLRRRARIDDKLEKLAAADALRAVKFAEVVVLLLDATIPFEKQDLTLADLVEREGRALVIGLGKWDLVADRSTLLPKLREDALRLLPQVKGAPVVPVSGATGAGIDKLMQAIVATHVVWNKRISTARLNRWLTTAIEASPPPAIAGRRIKIRYITQLRARPPYFLVFGNQLAALPASYERYLVNGLRQAFDLPGVPIRISRKTTANPYAGKDRGKS